MSVSRVETGELLGTGVADVVVRNSNISLHVCSSSLESAPLARILNDILDSQTGLTLRGSGLKGNETSNIATKVLQVVLRTFFFVGCLEY